MHRLGSSFSASSTATITFVITGIKACASSYSADSINVSKSAKETSSLSKTFIKEVETKTI